MVVLKFLFKLFGFKFIVKLIRNISLILLIISISINIYMVLRLYEYNEVRIKYDKCKSELDNISKMYVDLYDIYENEIRECNKQNNELVKLYEDKLRRCEYMLKRLMNNHKKKSKVKHYANDRKTEKYIIEDKSDSDNNINDYILNELNSLFK